MAFKKLCLIIRSYRYFIIITFAKGKEAMFWSVRLYAG